MAVYMGSTSSVFAVQPVPRLIAPLKYRSSLLISTGLRNSPFVSPAITHRRGKDIKMEATKIDVLDHDHKQQADEEFMLAAAGLRAEAMPKHVAIIADGHRRWAKQKGCGVEIGHMTLEPVHKDLTRLCCNYGIKVLTVYLSSTETWLRPQEEVDALINMFEEGIRSNLEESIKQDIRISVICDRTRLPESLKEVITEAEEKTRGKSRLHLILAIGYGGQNEILQACKNLCKKVKDGFIQEEEINDKIFEQELGTNICTPYCFPDLLIRPAGEFRLSNFSILFSGFADKTCWGV